MTHIDFKYFGKVFNSLYDFFQIKLIFAALATLLCWVFDNDFSALYVVYALMVIDCVLGTAGAIKRKEVNSRGFYHSAVKFTVYSLMMMTGELVDKNLGFAIASKTIEIFLSCTEGISILENISKLGFPVPQRLIQTLKVYYKK